MRFTVINFSVYIEIFWNHQIPLHAQQNCFLECVKSLGRYQWFHKRDLLFRTTCDFEFVLFDYIVMWNPYIFCKNTILVYINHRSLMHEPAREYTCVWDSLKRPKLSPQLKGSMVTVKLNNPLPTSPFSTVTSLTNSPSGIAGQMTVSTTSAKASVSGRKYRRFCRKLFFKARSRIFFL